MVLRDFACKTANQGLGQDVSPWDTLPCQGAVDDHRHRELRVALGQTEVRC